MSNDDSHQTQERPWLDAALDPRERAEQLVAAMTLEQKIEQLHGAMETIDLYTFMAALNEAPAEERDDMIARIRIERHVAGIESLGIPRFRVTNGPVGVGMGDGTPSPPATALPMTIGLAAGFDPELAARYGDIIGDEAASLGQHVLEGPGVGLHRLPTGGRNFEYFSEDPYLSGVMGVEVTRAIQSHGVIAMAKHFVLNDQETERFRLNVEVDERTLRELYLVPFEMLVKDADIAAIMSAYNRVRGTYATENRYLLHTILREQWGFAGYVQSDFWSCRSAASSLSAGMDHEMPDAKWLNEANVTAALNDTSLEPQTIDRALTRRYTQMFRLGQFDRPYAVREIDAVRNGAVAREIGTQIAVLLKNDGNLLPLSAESGRVVVIGQADYVDRACQGGGGSSKVDPLYTVAPMDGLRDVLAGLGSGVELSKITVADDLSNLDDAKAAAAAADTVVLMAGLVATEGMDQDSAELLNGQSDMIAALAPLNPRTVVVLKDGNPVLMPWIDSVPAVLEAWNQGAEDGHVVADLLFGVANPSGKVPTTYPRSWEDTPFAGHPERYPGVDEGDGYPTIRYSEGLRVGYRWYQSQEIEPLFAFGHGLSYTTFEVADLALDRAEAALGEPIELSLTVANTGERGGAEVVQVYVELPAACDQPPRRLIAFRKVHLAAGESQAVTIPIDPAGTHHPLSTWDVIANDFVQVPGVYRLHVGTSSASTPLVAAVEVG